MDRTSPRDAAAVRFMIRVIIAGAALWLLVAALTTRIEYYDGLSAIANARFFLGRSGDYIADRAPMMAWLLMPAEWVRSTLDLHTLDVRPHHAELAVLHVLYLIITWHFLSRQFGTSWPVLLAWVAAILSFVFFTYSPFLSHDIFPGALLLAMICRADDFSRQNSLPAWCALVALGTVAALTKQTFGVFWALVLLAALWRAVRTHDRMDRVTVVRLAVGAACSGAITWCVLGLIFADSNPSAPLLLRPWQNLQYLSSVYDGKDVTFPIWIYVRNFPSYGWLASLLVIPGWMLAMRGTKFEQSVAVAWLGGLIFLCVLPLREVRYMAFLAPLTAALLVSAIRRALNQRPTLVLVLMVLAADMFRSVREATEIFDPFYTVGIQRQFLALLDDPEYEHSAVLVSTPMLSFVSPTPSPFAADRYHRVFHFGVVHVRHLYGRTDLQILTPRGALQTISKSPDRSLLIYADQVLARGPGWTAGAPLGPEGFVQCTAIGHSMRIQLTDSSRAATATDVALLKTERADDNTRLQGAACHSIPSGELLPVLTIPSLMTAYWLIRSSPDSYVVLRAQELADLGLPQPARIRRFDVSTIMRIGARTQ